MKRLDVEQTYTSSIIVGPRLRSPNADAVDRMAASLSDLGLLVPIGVKIVDEMEIDGTVCCGVPVLIYGATRLAAAKQLGWEKIDTQIIDGDEIDARLAEIAENLHRAELSVQERADHIAEWVRLTDEKNKGAICADIPRGRGQPQGGVNAAVRELGIERTEAQRAVKIAGISEEARTAAADAGVTTQTGLLEIAKAATPEAQVAKVSELQKRRESRRVVSSAGDDIVKRDADEAAAQILIDKLSTDDLTELLEHLFAGTGAKIAKAVKRGQLDGTGRTSADVSVFDRTSAGGY